MLLLRHLNRLLSLDHLLLWDILSLLLLLLVTIDHLGLLLLLRVSIGCSRGLWILRGHGGNTLPVSRWTGRHRLGCARL